MSLDSMHERLRHFHKNFARIKNVSLYTKENEDLKAKVLDNGGVFFNELYDTYKEIYKEEKNGMNKKT